MTFRPRRIEASGSGEETSTPVNLTPLIDVSLVLVVILLLATPLAFESSIAVQRSSDTGRQADEVDELARIELHLIDEYQVVVNRETVALAQLGTALQPLLEASPAVPVLLRCEDEVSHGTFVTALDEAKAAGAARIAVVGRSR